MILVFLVVYLKMEPPRVLSYVLLYAAVSNVCVNICLWLHDVKCLGPFLYKEVLQGQ